MSIKLTKNYNYILFFYVLIMILDESNFKLNGEVSLVISSAKILILGVAILYFIVCNWENLKRCLLYWKQEVFLKQNLKVPYKIGAVLKQSYKIVFNSEQSWFLLLLIVINVVSMIKNGLEINIILLCMIVIISSKSSMSSIFKTFFYAFLTGVILVCLASKFGIIHDEINIRYSTDFLSSIFLHGNLYVRHSFGFEFSNQIPFALMTIYFLIIAWKQESITWRQHLLIEVINIYVFIFCGSRFVFMIVLGTNVLFYIVKYGYYNIKRTRLIRKCGYIATTAFGIGTVISFLFVLLYELTPKFIDAFLNFRLTYAFQAVQYYGIHFLGSGFDAGTFSGEIGVIVDNGYIMLFMQRGIIFAIITLALWTSISHLVVKNKNPYIMIPIIILALENFVDYQIISFRYIPFICLLCHTSDELLYLERKDKKTGILKLKKNGDKNIVMKIMELYKRYEEIRRTKTEVFQLMNSFDFSNIENNKPEKIENVVMLVPAVYPNLGGITSALRILSSLQSKSCSLTLAVCTDDMTVEEARKNAMLCMPNYEGQVKRVDECEQEDYDICIATSWQTAYYAKKISGYKIYFVQDYEPEFYETNDFSALAKNTYSLGYHIISLGQWNADKIKLNCQNCTSRIDIVDFPYDPNEYSFDQRNYDNYKNKKEITIACYIRFIGRRIPYICEYLLSNAKKYMEEKGYKLNVLYFGIDKKNHFNEATNLGKLSRHELYELYQKCDFGMTASMSNISLVPYEMLATGLPLIEFRTGSYRFFLGEDTALLIDFDYKELADKIIEAVNSPEILKLMHQKAEEKLGQLSWKNTCEQFWNILSNVRE